MAYTHKKLMQEKTDQNYFFIFDVGTDENATEKDIFVTDSEHKDGCIKAMCGCCRNIFKTHYTPDTIFFTNDKTETLKCNECGMESSIIRNIHIRNRSAKQTISQEISEGKYLTGEYNENKELCKLEYQALKSDLIIKSAGTSFKTNRTSESISIDLENKKITKGEYKYTYDSNGKATKNLSNELKYIDFEPPKMDTFYMYENDYLCDMLAPDINIKMNEKERYACIETLLKHYAQKGLIDESYTDAREMKLIKSSAKKESPNNLLNIKDNTSENRTINLLILMTSYPAAFLYAYEKAQIRNNDFIFNEKRKEENSPFYKKYTAKELPDSVKYKNFREELIYMTNLLLSCPEKIREAVRECDTVPELKARMQYFVFGNNEPNKAMQETVVPMNMKKAYNRALSKDTDAFEARTYGGGKEGRVGKKSILYRYYNDNCIAAANTCYNLHIAGFKNTETVNYVAEKVMNDAYGETRYVKDPNQKNKYQLKIDGPKNNYGYKTIPPFSKNARKFIRTYLSENKEHHTELSMAEFMFDTNYPRLLAFYSELDKYMALTKTEISTRGLEEYCLKNYMTTRPITGAYATYTEKYGKDAVYENINRMASHFDLNHKIDMALYSEMKKNDGYVPKDKNRIVNDFINRNEYSGLTQEQKQKLADTVMSQILIHDDTKYLPHSRKSLFSYDTCSEIFEKAKEYYGSFKKLPSKKDCLMPVVDADYRNERLYNVGTEENPKYYYVKLLKSSHDYIDCSETMSNCLKNHIRQGKRRDEVVYNIITPDGNIGACVDLFPIPENDNRACYQLDMIEGPGDRYINGELGEVAKYWLKDINVETSYSRDYTHIGETGMAYGREYNVQRVTDPVLTLPVSTDSYKQMMTQRTEKAKEAWGYEPETDKILVPDPPEELRKYLDPINVAIERNADERKIFMTKPEPIVSEIITIENGGGGAPPPSSPAPEHENEAERTTGTNINLIAELRRRLNDAAHHDAFETAGDTDGDDLGPENSFI